MKSFYDVRFTEVIHRHYHLSVLATSEQEAIDLARSGDSKSFDEERIDSFDYRAEKIDYD